MAATSLDEKPEEELTNEERMAWLRQRGVIVEEPADRRGRAAGAGGGAGGAGRFCFVRIPCDDRCDVEERSAASGEGDVLPALLRCEFAGDAGVTDDQLLAQAAQMGQSVGVAAMRSVLAQGGAETFRLAVPTEENGGEAVYAYLDEASALKGLPFNERATALAGRCGFPAACKFYGDIFIGRQKWHKHGVIENIDFRPCDLESSAVWPRRAIAENLQFQKDTQPEEHARAQENGRPDAPASGEGQGYTWRDDDEELEVEVTVEKGTSKKDVKVDFRRQEVRVTKPISLSLKLYRPVDLDGCNWTMGDGKIVLTLSKASAVAWPQLLAD
eukprot:TRINITY_DN2611_c1_g3_i1.p1 TRINITY_DN2611_c1_g3~~TRINITY_DN2611_c1_g3_i1.p1  ORF type:complete len:347 (+),score=90.60 TRINITY_DN2611_c1_g3_i1:57-1043(+)